VVPKRGLDSHPCRVVSNRYQKIVHCHGRGREFESRRPRHSFQKSWADLAETIEGFSANLCSRYLTALSRPVQDGPPFASEENTSGITAACAACFAGVTACV
jgi:hypothetical protein